MAEPGYDPFRGETVESEDAQAPLADEGLPKVEGQRDEYVAPGDDEVPAGSAKEVLDWVGDDKDRAQQALDAEETKPNGGRKGLKNDLQELLN